MKDGDVLIVSPIKGERPHYFSFCFVQITIFWYQWQKKYILTLFTLNELINISAPNTMHILQCNLVIFSTMKAFIPFLVNSHFYYLKTLLIVSDKISIFISPFSNRQEQM